MKSDGHPSRLLMEVSPPAWGAWIEMRLTAGLLVSSLSPPTRGAWIEIIVGGSLMINCFVAPHTGGVD